MERLEGIIKHFWILISERIYNSRIAYQQLFKNFSHVVVIFFLVLFSQG